MRWKQWLWVLVLALSLSAALAAESCNNEEEEEVPERYPLTVWNWKEVKVPLSIVLWLVVASVAKLIFHAIPHLTEMFPDSALLIMVGLVIGIIFSFTNIERSEFFLNNRTFMLYLLPPLVFDAGYFMPARQFFDNLGSILAFAMIGTTWNIVSIALSLWAISLTGLFSVETNVVQMLLFGSIAADVDPVAVIVIFEELGVNDVLFISVFGESLLNDGVAVVFYRMFSLFTQMLEQPGSSLIARDYVFGGLSYLIVCVGGIGLGIIFGLGAAFITKYSRDEEVRVLNAIFVILLPYLCYLVSEMLGFSSIMAIVFCGAIMKQYVKENVPDKALSGINYFIKVLSMASETVIFVFLGLSTVSSDHHWDSAFVVLSCVFCLVYRTLGVVFLCTILNKYRLNKFSKVDQFIIAYGGLRGAIAYGLVVALPEIPAKNMFITSTIVIIYFTVFLQGITLKPIAEFLMVEKKNVHKKNMTEHIYQELIDYTMSGMEDIAGFKGHHWIRDTWQYVNNRFMKPIFVNKRSMKEMDNTKIVRMWKKLQLEDAKDLIKGGGDISRNQVFVQALMDHTRSRSNTLRANSKSESPPGGFTSVDLSVIRDHHGVTIYDKYEATSGPLLPEGSRSND